MAVAALYTVLSRTLIRATIFLAVTSIVLSIIMFRLGATFAAVFELSVCAGLITAIFISTISLTKPMTLGEIVAINKNRFKRYKYLFLVLAVVILAVVYFQLPKDFINPAPGAENDVRKILWHIRKLDIVGQIVILLSGVFAVTIFFGKEKEKE